jgi:plasmid stability protein
MSKIQWMTDKQVPSYPLRMPFELRKQLTVVAKNNNRSVNAEIIARLESSLATEGANVGLAHGAALRTALAASLADVAVLSLTQDESWKEDVARRVTENLRKTSSELVVAHPAAPQKTKTRQRSKKD